MNYLNLGVLLNFIIAVMLISSFLSGLHGGFISTIVIFVNLIVSFVVSKALYLPLKQAIINLLNLNALPGSEPSHLAGLITFLLIFMVTWSVLEGIFAIFIRRANWKIPVPIMIIGGILNVFLISIFLGIFVYALKVNANTIYSELFKASFMFRYLSFYASTGKVLYDWGSKFFVAFYNSL